MPDTIVQKTEDYTLFKTIPGNRTVSQAHKRRLEAAIEQNAEIGQYDPIIVNEKFEVIDGQHRVQVYENLGLPVHYIVAPGLKLEDVQTINSLSKTWSPMDYAKSYSDLGNEHYKQYILFKKKYGINHDVLIRYLALDENITGQMFKDGKLKATNIAKSHDLCRKLIEIGQYYDGYHRRAFAFAFKAIWENPNYDHGRMLKKMAKYADKKMQDFSKQTDYQRLLEEIYNYRESAESTTRLF